MATTKTAPKPKRKPTSRGGAAGLITAASGQSSAAATALPLDAIDATHFTNPRGDVDESSPAFGELVDSIRELDVLQPIVVGPALVKGGKHPLLAGWRRYHAAKVVGLDSIPVRQLTEIREAKDALVAAIAENVARDDMTPLAEARAIDTLMREHGLTQVAAGKRIGMSERSVRERLRILSVQEASPVVAQAMSDQIIPVRAATWFAELTRIAPEAAERVIEHVSKDAGSGSEQYTASDLASTAYADDLVEDALRDAPDGGAKLAVNIAGWIFVSRLPFPERRLKPLLARLDGSNTVDVSDDALERLVGQGLAVRSPAGGAWAYPGEWLFNEVEAAVTAQEQARAALQKSAAPTAPGTTASAAAPADQPSPSEVEAARSEREREAHARDLAHHANVILGERLSLQACAKLAEGVDAAKALAHFLVTDELKRLLERGQRYTDPAHVTETVAKNGTVKRKYELDDKATDELRDHIDAATTPAEAIAPVLRAMLLALHADEQVTAQSNRAYYSWPYGKWGDAGGSRSAKAGLEHLRDVVDLPALQDQARERAAATTPEAPTKTAAPKLGKWGAGALELITARPGITIPELAEALKLQQNMLYRVVPGLQKDGLIRKEGRGWHLVEATS